MERSEAFKDFSFFKRPVFTASIKDNLCITCMFWSGYRKRDGNVVTTISENVEGICLWHSNSSTKVSHSCKHWIGKY